MCHHHQWGKHARHRHHHHYWKMVQDRMAAPVNIREYDDRFELHVFAPGYDKADFTVKVKDSTLLIKAKVKEQELVDDFDRLREEYRPQGFKRYFDLGERIDKSHIQAAYREGVLVVTLTKTESAVTERFDIDIV